MRMPVIRTTKYTDIPETLDTLDSTADMLQAFGVMLEYTVRSGDDVSYISSGMEQLLNQQCEDLKFLKKALLDQFNQFRESKLAVRDLKQVAEWSGVSANLAARVIKIATGINLDPAKPKVDSRFNEEFGYAVTPENVEA